MARRFHASLETLAFRFLSGFGDTHSNIAVAFKNPTRRSDQSSIRHLFVLTSHAELSGWRQGWRIITDAGKAVESPQEAVEMCPNVRRRIWVRALNPRSKYVKAPGNFRSTGRGLGSYNPPRIPCDLPCATRNHRRDPPRQTLVPKVHSGASQGGAHPKRSQCPHAPAGGPSSKDPWQICRSPGTQEPRHSL